MQNWNDRANSIHWPPILYGMALVLPWLLQRLLPFPKFAFEGIFGQVLAPIGWAVVASGVMVGYLAIKSFSAVDTPFDPTAKAKKLVTFGLYNQSRNPMYLAALIAFFGLALASGNLWRFAALPMLFWGLQKLAVLREERHLETRFGEDWLDYKTRVNRWW